MHFSLSQYIILGLMAFIAGFIDSIAGGGGLISLPTLLSLGIPPHYVLGTNKFASSCGTSFATFRYFRNGSINARVAVFSVIGALVGSPVGAKLALILDEKFLKIVLIAALPLIAALVLTRKNFGGEDTSSRWSAAGISAMSLAIGLILGLYDGFFGPGTGTFLVLAFTGVLGMSLITASGNTKIVNLSSNVGALVTFLINGKVIFSLGIVAAIFNIAGNWLGSGLAIRRGAKVIRPVLIIAFCLLLAKIVFDMAGPSVIAFLDGVGTKP